MSGSSLGGDTHRKTSPRPIPGGKAGHGKEEKKQEDDKDNPRLLGTIDTREMKELMRRLNFTKYATRSSVKLLNLCGFFELQALE